MELIERLMEPCAARLDQPRTPELLGHCWASFDALLRMPLRAIDSEIDVLAVGSGL